MSYPHGDTLVILRRSEDAEDAHGNPTVAFTPQPPIGGVAFDPGGTVERYETGRDPVTTSPRVLSRQPLPAAARDRVQIRGRTYEVDGDVAEYRNPWTGFSGWVLTLKTTEG